MASFIYPVVVAWTWGYRWISAVGDIGYMDFACSGIVRLTGGVSALAGTLALGPRKGPWERLEEFDAHSLPFVVLGTLPLWSIAAPRWHGRHGRAGGHEHCARSCDRRHHRLRGAYVIAKMYSVGGLLNGVPLRMSARW